MVKQNHILLLLAMAMLFASCSKGHQSDCFKSKGPYSVETRYPESFNRIEVRDNINLYLIQDSLNYVVIEGGGNLIGGIEIEVNDSELIISDGNKCNWVRSLDYQTNVYLHYTSFSKLTANNSGDNYFLTQHHGDSLIIENWNGSGTTHVDMSVNSSLLAVHAGSGDIVAKGFSGLSSVYNSGCGPIDARDLVTNTTYLRSRSNHNVYINATNSMVVEIDWSGNVYYKGNPPSLDIIIRGTGQLIHID